MVGIDHLTIEAADETAAERFYAAFGIEDRVRVRATQAASTGFRGFTLSLIVAHAGDVDEVYATALAVGAEALKPGKKSLWGYGAIVQAPDGTICTIASSTKKNLGGATGHIDEVVLQLGVSDVGASREFYSDRGFPVAKSYGRKYVEFDAGRVGFTLNRREALAKVADVSPDGTGSHRLAVSTDAGSFTDPDGFIWEAT